MPISKIVYSYSDWTPLLLLLLMKLL